MLFVELSISYTGLKEILFGLTIFYKSSVSLYDLGTYYTRLFKPKPSIEMTESNRPCFYFWESFCLYKWSATTEAVFFGKDNLAIAFDRISWSMVTDLNLDIRLRAIIDITHRRNLKVLLKCLKLASQGGADLSKLLILSLICAKALTYTSSIWTSAYF